MRREIIMLLLLPCSVGAMHDHLVIDAIRNNRDITIEQLEEILNRPNAQFSEHVATAVFNFGMTGQRTPLINLLNDNQEAMVRFGFRIDLAYLKIFFLWVLFGLNPTIISDK